MTETLCQLLESHREALYLFFRRLRALDQPFLTWPELNHEYERFVETDVGATLRETQMGRVVRHTHDILVDPPMLYLGVRSQVARWRFVQIHIEEMQCREISVGECLAAKERLVLGGEDEGRYVLEVDLAPFERGLPRPSRSTWIGRGVEYLNRFLSSRLFEQDGDGRQRFVEFLRVHQVRGRQLMLNGMIEDPDQLRRGLRSAVDAIKRSEDQPDWPHDLRALGFEPGWGDSAERVRETMELALDVLDAPSPDQLGEFLARIPMITSIAVVSPHGYFGQANVLGKPDTGGQVVYILDQVRALEKEMRASLRRQGLDIDPQIVVLTRLIPQAEDTTCDQRLEPILGTDHARILRVPFRGSDGEVVREWVSRFEIWPYLERYAVDAERELLAELGTRPDFIIGNYSDGNLVASIMAHRLGVTQCNIAHALEKTKYENSDLQWSAHESEHHFSCQFTADLIAMNTADFIITSTRQEIAGTDESVGQYESYQAYTMPALYRVVSGIDCFDPKFNIVSPGADAAVFFPHWEHEHRSEELTDEIRDLIFGDPPSPYRGSFERPEKPLLFAMSRLDRIKNMTGLLEWYGRNEALRERVNLLLVGGWLDPEWSSDRDERRQIERQHELIDTYGLEASTRWVEMQTDKNRVGEIYRVVADTRGAFVQPALFEAFGLTVVEAMASGLPVFVTRYGGPLEIVEEGESGFHIDPTQPDEASRVILQFFETTEEEPAEWDRIARTAVDRVQARYNWRLYASTLLRLSRVYGFWKYITSLERNETRRYLEMFYALMYRPLARALERGDSGPREDGSRPEADAPS